MAWTAPIDWVDEYVVQESDMDEQVSGNLNYLKAWRDLGFHAKAYAILDLSGAAQSNVPILHSINAVTLINATLLYTEASSADAGVAVKIGKETDDDYYYTGTSEVSKALWYEKDATLLQTDVGAGDTVICSSAGGKAGTGEILVCIEYTIDIA